MSQTSIEFPRGPAVAAGGGTVGDYVSLMKRMQGGDAVGTVSIHNDTLRLRTAKGSTTVLAGDWILLSKQGEIRVMTDREFKLTYEEMSDG